MRYVVALFAVLGILGVASAASAAERAFGISSFRPGQITGTMHVTINSEGSEPFVFEYPVPAFTCCSGSRVTITEATAGSYGLDWAALEAIVAGPEAKSISFGPLGLVETQPFLREASAGWITDVELTEVGFSFLGLEHWVTASFGASGDFTVVAPEPASVLLFGLCLPLAHCFMAQRLRRPGALRRFHP